MRHFQSDAIAVTEVMLSCGDESVTWALVSKLDLVTIAWERGGDVDMQGSLTIRKAGFGAGNSRFHIPPSHLRVN